MTTRPGLNTSERQVYGLLAVGLFVVMAGAFLAADFGSATGFPGDGSITASIGYAMFDLAGGTFESEGFLVAFEIVDVVLVAALAAAVMLARREGEGIPLTDGGRADAGDGDAPSGAGTTTADGDSATADPDGTDDDRDRARDRGGDR